MMYSSVVVEVFIDRRANHLGGELNAA
jgi:hypothetical protein